MFTAPDAHMHTSLSYTLLSIQSVNKAIEHLINSIIEKEKQSSQCLSIKNGKGDEEEKKRKSNSHKQSEGLGGVLWGIK